MKIFISYAFTGEDERAVAERLERISAALQQQGHDVYCFQFDEKRHSGMTSAESIRRALEKMLDYDAVLAINTSPRRSEGMLIEIGAALARGKKLIFAQHQSAVGTSHLPSLADIAFVWESNQELLDQATKHCA